MTEGKKVIYNGKTKSYCSCSDPSILEKGKEYEIADIKVNLLDTTFSLVGIDGWFSSSWFDHKNISSESKKSNLEDYAQKKKSVYLGYSKYIPRIDHRLKNLYVLNNNGNLSKINYTLKVADISEIGSNIFKCETFDATYYVLIIK